MDPTAKTTLARVFSLAALVALVLVAALLGFRHLVREAPEAATPRPFPAVARTPEQGTSVAAVRGDVERIAPGGARTKLEVGTSLSPDDRVHTAGGAEADLRFGAGSLLTVKEASDLGVRELTATARRFKLERGRVSVDYQADGDRLLRIEDLSGAAVAETRAGRFDVASGEAGFAVATQTGTVTLSARDGSVSVGAGQDSIARPGRSPTAPSAIPIDLLLRVAERARPDEALCAELVGRVGPASEVRVDGAEVEVAADGAFDARVPLRAGRRSASIEVRDAEGRRRQQIFACAVPEANVQKLKIRWQDSADDGGTP